MKRLFILSTLSFAVILLSHCSPKTGTAVSSTPTTSSSEGIVAEIKKNYTEDQMAAGNAIRTEKCNRCHKLFEPSSRTIEKWENILPDMFKRAHLNNEDAGKVRAYILANARMS